MAEYEIQMLFPKMSVNCLIHLSDYRDYLLFLIQCFQCGGFVSDFTSLQSSVLFEVVTLEYWRYSQNRQCTELYLIFPIPFQALLL